MQRVSSLGPKGERGLYRHSTSLHEKLIKRGPSLLCISSIPELQKPVLQMMMLLIFFHRLVSRWPLLLCAAVWTVLLTLAVAVASFGPEIAFVSAISPSSSFSKPCKAHGFLRIPLDNPSEVMCFPAHFVRRSTFDFFLPTVFAALVVSGSACMVRSLGLWESTQTEY